MSSPDFFVDMSSFLSGQISSWRRQNNNGQEINAVMFRPKSKQSRKLWSFTSSAKEKLLTFIFTVKWSWIFIYVQLLLPLKINFRQYFYCQTELSRKLWSFNFSAKYKLLTFIFTYLYKRSRMLRSFTAVTKDKLPTFIFYRQTNPKVTVIHFLAIP